MQAERRCEQCGQMIPWGERKCPACGENGRFFWSLPRNTLLLLSFLLLIILFVITGFAVKAYHAKERALARQWYVSGERELTAGHAEAALEDFRSALVYSPNDSLIELQLAHALAAAGHLPEARAYLLGLWERELGDGTVNLELARLAADSGSAPEAAQYYHDAIYGQWNDDPAEHRRRARLELAEFLLGVGQKAQAQAELIALTADLPRDPPLQTQVAAVRFRQRLSCAMRASFRSNERLFPRAWILKSSSRESRFDMLPYVRIPYNRCSRKALPDMRRKGFPGRALLLEE
jgi:hypothetical protein